MLHDLVGTQELPSADRLNATFRSLGILFGPVVGSVLLLGLGPARGTFVNVAAQPGRPAGRACPRGRRCRMTSRRMGRKTRWPRTQSTLTRSSGPGS